jgi:predicted Zn-dependent protease
MNAFIAAAQLPRAGRTEEARHLSRRTLADEPRQVAATVMLSRLMLNDGDPHGAWALLNAVGDPDDPRLAAAQWETGQTLMRAGFWEATAPENRRRDPCRRAPAIS